LEIAARGLAVLGGGGPGLAGCVPPQERQGLANREAGSLVGQGAHELPQAIPVAVDGHVAGGGRVGEGQVFVAPGFEVLTSKLTLLVLGEQETPRFGGGL